MSENGLDRRLSAAVAAYSQLAALDEESTVANLSAHRCPEM